jgi:hypothetical protein
VRLVHDAHCNKHTNSNIETHSNTAGLWPTELKSHITRSCAAASTHYSSLATRYKTRSKVLSQLFAKNDDRQTTTCWENMDERRARWNNQEVKS